MRRRIAVTGMGVVCSAGTDLPTFTQSILKGVSALALIDDPRVSHFRARNAGLARSFDTARYAALLPQTANPDRYALLAVAAALEALGSAGITDCAGLEMGVFFATCSGPMHSIEGHYETLRKNGRSGVPHFNTRYYSAAKLLAHLLGISGPNATVTTACSASINAIGTACDLINDGTVSIALAGGADSFSLTTLAGFDGLKATCPQECAPFSKPYGMNLGEGGGFVVIEDLVHARKRGAQVIAEILGYGSSNDAYHETSPDPTGRGPSSAMVRALTRAGFLPESITYVNAHGTGTEANDKAETRAVRKVFGPHADALPVSSTKSITGHCLGAAGVVELIASIACSREAILPPTANFSEPRDGCTLDHVGTPGRAWTPPGPFMKNNLAFGGNNASLIVTTHPAENTASPDKSVREPICITGIGVVSPAGVGPQILHEFIQGARLDQPTRSVGDLDPRSVDRRLDLRGVDRASKYAVIAASQAIAQAKFGSRPADRAEIGFYYHCAHGPAWAEADHINSLLREDFRISQLTAFPYIVPNSVTGTLCRLLSLTGHNSTFCLGPGAGLAGLQYAASAIRNGHVSAMLTGSADEVSDADTAYALIEGADRTPAEGAVMMMLETESAAAQRGVPVLGVLLSCVNATEAASPDGRDGGNAVLEGVIRRALETAGVGASEISILCASVNSREHEAARRMLPNTDVNPVDVAPWVGVASSSSPLLNTVCALKKAQSGCILAVYSSPAGFDTAAVFRVADR